MKMDILFSVWNLPKQETKSIFEIYQFIFDYIHEIDPELLQNERPKFFRLAKKLLQLLSFHYKKEEFYSEQEGLIAQSNAIDKLIIKHSSEYKHSKIQGIEINADYFTQNKKLYEQISESIKSFESYLGAIYLKLDIGELERNDFDNLYFTTDSIAKKVTDLITQSIELIESDQRLNTKTKTKIIAILENVLEELKYNKVPRVWSKVKESIFILGALSSFAGGYSIFSEAQEKLNQAAEIIEQTSINYNYAQSGRYSEYFNAPLALSPDQLNQHQLPPVRENQNLVPVETTAELVDNIDSIVDKLIGIARTNSPAPTDGEVQKMLEERKLEKHK